MPTPPAPVASAAGPRRLGVARMLRTPGYRRLLAVRFATQWGDGLFQAALGGALLFNPERQADPLAVAAGLAVLLLPYSLVGPFAGALLDRWDRSRILQCASVVRAALVLVVAGVVLAGIDGPGFYVAALVAAGVNRFVLAGLSAALPHVVERRHLVEANTLAVTAGSAMAAVGAASAIGIRAVAGPDDAGSAVTTAVAAVGALLAAAVAAGFGRGVLGPDRTDGRVAGPDGTAGTDPGRNATGGGVPGLAVGGAAGTDRAAGSSRAGGTARAVLRGFVDGARVTAATPPVAGVFLALAAHRLAFGITTLLTLLLFRNAFTDSGLMRAGLAGIGEAVVAAAVGLGCAAFVTPWLVHRLGRARTVRVALLVAAATQVGLALLLGPPAVFAAAFGLGLAGQVVKLCTDAAVQSEVRDTALGRVFALYDVVFNVGYVVAVATAALLAPPDGDAPWLIGAAAALYVGGLLAHDAQLRRTGRAPAAEGT